MKLIDVLKSYRNMKSKFEELNVKFKAMIYSSEECFTENDVKIGKVKKFIAKCFPELSPQLDEQETIDDLLELVMKKCNILNVQPLEVMAETFKVDKAVGIIRAYKNTVEEFYESVFSGLHIDREMQATNRCLRCEFVMDQNSDEVCDALQGLKNLSISIEKNECKELRIAVCLCPPVEIVLLIALILEKADIVKGKGVKKFSVETFTIWDSTVQEVYASHGCCHFMYLL